MTFVFFRLSSDGLYVGFTALGHSGYGERGTDIVCAGISAIALTACSGMSHFLGRSVRIDQVGGCLSAILTVPIDGSDSERCDTILRTAALGLRRISLQYPRHLRVFNVGFGHRRYTIIQ